MDKDATRYSVWSSAQMPRQEMITDMASMLEVRFSSFPGCVVPSVKPCRGAVDADRLNRKLL